MTRDDALAVLPHLPDTNLVLLSSIDVYRAYELLLAGQGGEPVPITEESPVRSTSDRKSTRLNSSHPSISYAVFCLKKKKTIKQAGTGGRRSGAFALVGRVSSRAAGSWRPATGFARWWRPLATRRPA